MEQIIKENFKVLTLFLEKIDFNFYSKNDCLKEIEVKVKVEEDIFKKLKEADTEYVTSKYERNFMYDLKGQDLKKDGVVCRVRRERDLRSGAQNILLTLKKRVETQDNFKEQIELESKVSDEELEKLDNALNESNLVTWFLYEKFRHIFKVKDANVEIVVDVLPLIGRFIEIEGEREEILKALKIIGIEEKDTQKSSYINLFKSHKRGTLNEYKFSQYEAFLVAEKEIMLISENWPLSESSCGHSCSCCSHSCHSCSEE